MSSWLFALFTKAASSPFFKGRFPKALYSTFFRSCVSLQVPTYSTTNEPTYSITNESTYSNFPHGAFNAEKTLSGNNAWRRPTTPMPKCGIRLNILEEHLPRFPPRLGISSLFQSFHDRTFPLAIISEGYTKVERRPLVQRITSTKQQDLDCWWNKSLTNGVIEICQPSAVLHIAPMYRVPKKKVHTELGHQMIEWRWIIDYRVLNFFSHRGMGHSIPIVRYHIPQFIAWCSCMPSILKIDLVDAFYSCPIEDSSQKYFGIQNGRQFAYFRKMPPGQ